MYFGIGPSNYLRKIFASNGEIVWSWFAINSIFFLALFAFIVTTISFYLKSSTVTLTRETLKEELSSVLNPPGLQKLNTIAEKKKTTVEALLRLLEEGDSF